MSGFWVISGASRGLGGALARAATAAGEQVLGIARGEAAAGESLRWDLASPEGLYERLAACLDAAMLQSHPPERWVLVNNAGLLGPIGSHYRAGDVTRVMQVNLGAAILLSRCFVDRLAGSAAPKRIINLSSGAATRVIRGWSLYSASKAGLEHFGRCLAAEQAGAAHPVDVLNLSPGVIDTDMQAQIRAAGDEGFPDRQRFVDLHAHAALASPESVADSILHGVGRAQRYAGATLSLAEFAAP